ncbi:MAG: HAD family hydrolase [Promethearchaeota archaeon]
MRISEKNQVKIIIFDIDDTLWHAVDDDRAINRFERIDERRVTDQPGVAQELVENAHEVLKLLNEKGYVLAIGTMGPEDQVRMFMKAFGIFQYFNFEISKFDRVDKADKVEHTLLKAREFMEVEPEQIVFVDDNLGYLQAVNERFPGVKCIWGAQFQMSPGLKLLNEAMEEQYGIKLW